MNERFESANELWKHALAAYRALQGCGEIPRHQRDRLIADWQAAHHAWWAEVQAVLADEAERNVER